MAILDYSSYIELLGGSNLAFSVPSVQAYLKAWIRSWLDQHAPDTSDWKAYSPRETKSESDEHLKDMVERQWNEHIVDQLTYIEGVFTWPFVRQGFAVTGVFAIFLLYLGALQSDAEVCNSNVVLLLGMNTLLLSCYYIYLIVFAPGGPIRNSYQSPVAMALGVAGLLALELLILLCLPAINLAAPSTRLMIWATSMMVVPVIVFFLRITFTIWHIQDSSLKWKADYRREYERNIRIGRRGLLPKRGTTSSTKN